MSTLHTFPHTFDIVGSFLRPQELKEARAAHLAGTITDATLREVEDLCILELIQKQQEVGLLAITDGEFRRRWWHLDFIAGLTGITKYTIGDIITFQNVSMERAEAGYISSPLSFPNDHPFLADFKFLHEHAGDSTAKQTIPGPIMIYLGGALLEPHYRERPIYETLEDLEDAIVTTYQTAIQAFYDAGCRYLQLDDTAWGKLFDPASRAQLTELGYTADELIIKCTELTRRCLENKPADLTLTFHFCRGNFKSSWVYEGGYDFIAEQLFSIDAFDGFFLEYDSERSGSFTPLAHLRHQKIVLGLLTSKTAELESPEDILARVVDAKKYVASKQICISPQCGFASTEDGNNLTEAEQWAKIRHLVAIAQNI